MKAQAHEFFGISHDIPVIGTVMRNQSRKLYPDLIDAFSLMKQKYQGNTTIDKSVLIIHSTWPDNAYSYDYPRHIMRLQSYDWMDYFNKGIMNHILQTAMCHECGKKHATFAMHLYGKPVEKIGDSAAIMLPCPHCGKRAATPPTTGGGYNREELSLLYSLMDLYVQSSICEGDGMPIQEAKACGVPTLVTDYTAMREKGRIPNYKHIKKE
jgi:glycosyltransferase involved in cell wall biosynthesis